MVFTGLEVAAAVASIVSAFGSSADLTGKLLQVRRSRVKEALQRTVKDSAKDVSDEYNNDYRRLGPRFAVGDSIALEQLHVQLILLQQSVISLLESALANQRRYHGVDFSRLISASKQARHQSIRALPDQYQRMILSAPIATYALPSAISAGFSSPPAYDEVNQFRGDTGNTGTAARTEGRVRTGWRYFCGGIFYFSMLGGIGIFLTIRGNTTPGSVHSVQAIVGYAFLGSFVLLFVLFCVRLRERLRPFMLAAICVLAVTLALGLCLAIEGDIHQGPDSVLYYSGIGLVGLFAVLFFGFCVAIMRPWRA